MAPAGARLAGLTWPEAEARLAAGAVPVLPIGAAAKEHGHHLPMATDARQADWLGAALAARHPVLVWPTLNIGHYPAFTDYPGSVSIDAALFTEVLRQVGASIRRHSRAPVLLVNTGISTIRAIDALLHGASADLRAAHVYRGEHYRSALATHTGQRHGGHGDEAETAIMLAIDPDAVRMAEAQAFDHAPPPGPLSRRPGDPGHTPQGVWGDPTRATAVAGRALLAAMLRDLADAVLACTAAISHDPAHRDSSPS